MNPKKKDGDIVLPISLKNIENADLAWDILERTLGDTENQEWLYENYDALEIGEIRFDTCLDEFSLANLYEDSRARRVGVSLSFDENPRVGVVDVSDRGYINRRYAVSVSGILA